MSRSVTQRVLRELAQGTDEAARQAAARLIWFERGRNHALLGLNPLPSADLRARGRLIADAYVEGWDSVDTKFFSFKSRAPRGL